MDNLASDLKMALDPVAFAVDALGFKPDDWQARVLRWNGKRLLLNCSRQSGKSTTTAIVALHRALYVPDALVLLVSPSERQSRELFIKVVDFMHRLDVQPDLIEDNKLSLRMAHGARVVSLPGKEATIRGYSGATLIIEDESSRVPDELYYAIRPMLAVSGGQLILMSTPYGKRGHFHKEWTAGGDEWQRIEVKATECPRITTEFLQSERRALGDYFFAQEYGCEFRDTVDQIFPSDLIQAAVTSEVKPLF
jgi:hypothetical protein